MDSGSAVSVLFCPAFAGSSLNLSSKEVLLAPKTPKPLKCKVEQGQYYHKVNF